MLLSDHTIAIVQGLSAPMLGAEAIVDVYKSESPAWGKRGFLMEKRRVGTVRFTSRSTGARKSSTNNGAGSGRRPAGIEKSLLTEAAYLKLSALLTRIWRVEHRSC